ncbi:hypothetical protein H0H93_002932 [Arthromyces matolae]|nr:hypothetical protein H0H93_002932 [Arthromyces matolae]
MPLFKKKDQNLIPPVQDTIHSGSTSPTYSYRSNASTYVPSRDGDPYNSSRGDLYSTSSSTTAQYPPSDSVVDKYSRSRGVGDVYSRGGAEIEQDRNELFSGYKPTKSGSGRFFDGPQSGPEPNAGEENEEDVEGIKQQMRFTKQESVNSTRNALRMAREAEETARNTLTRLEIVEKLANTERHLDVAKGHSARAEDNTNELKQLNRSIFRPVIVFNKDAKRAAQEAKIRDRYEEDRQEREKTMMDVRESQNRLGRAATYGRNEDEELIGAGSFRSRMRTAEQQEQRKRYQFEATASDDELEDELDGNLDEISEATKRLKALGVAMGSELDSQNTRIDQIEGKAVRVEQKIFMNTQRNAAILRSLGLDQPLFEPPENTKKPKDTTTTLKKRKTPTEATDDHESATVVKAARVEERQFTTGSVRRSVRNSGKKVDYTAEQQRTVPLPITDKGEQESSNKEKKVRLHDPPTVAGISGGPDGAYSVALSGGYEDDVDLGYALYGSRKDHDLTYTGSGGRDLKGTKAAPKNHSCDTGKPIRVVRGYKLRSNYRYDGLYKVEKAWIEQGLNAGKFLVCKFAFKRLPGQPPLPIRTMEVDQIDEQTPSTHSNEETMTNFEVPATEA